MSNNGLYKFGVGYSFQDSDRRVIDSNALVATKLEQLSATMQQNAYEEPSFGEDFAAGLDSVAVEKLLEDGDESFEEFSEGLFGTDETAMAEGSGNVIKAPRRNAAPEMVPQIDIEAETERLLSEARLQAEEIINNANEEAVSIMENAKAMGYDEGFRAGSAQAEEDYQQRFAELSEQSEALNEQYNQMLDQIEPMMVETLTDIYEHIIHVKFSDQKEIIFHLLHEALRNVDGTQDFVIHVSKEDFGYVSMQKKDLLSGMINGNTAEIVEDVTLRKNECFIETGGGIFDCSLQTQLSGLKRELRLLSYVKND